MSQTQITIRRSAARLLFGFAALGLLTFVCFRLGLDFTTTAIGYLLLIVSFSPRGGFMHSMVLSILAVGCLNYFFTEPIFFFRMRHYGDVAELVAFLTSALVLSGRHFIPRTARSPSGVLP